MSAAGTISTEITEEQAIKALVEHLRSHGVGAADGLTLDLLRAVHDWVHEG